MAEAIGAGALLELVAGAVIEGLAGSATEAAIVRLRTPAARQAFQRALGSAVARYAASDVRLPLARPLFQPSGPLADPQVARELAKLLQFHEEPDYELIGKRWWSDLQDPPSWRVPTTEARLLVDLLRSELMEDSVFQPTFQTQSLASINASAAVSRSVLQAIEDQLTSLNHLIDSQFGVLLDALARAPSELHRGVKRDVTYLIEQRSTAFVGRTFVFQALDEFVSSHRSGYFVIRGDPGIGKSAIAAQLVKTRGMVHHFNDRKLNVVRAEQFLNNVSAQIISRYRLPYTSLPAGVNQDGTFFSALLHELPPIERERGVLIVIDALDEIDDSQLRTGANPLFLPHILPDGLYFIVTSRRTAARITSDSAQRFFEIVAKSEPNMKDIREHIAFQMQRPGIQQYIQSQQITDIEFVDVLAERSVGNFMYLHHILPEIERGAYQHTRLDHLPSGLQSYYEDHWGRMRGEATEDWLNYRLPVILALTAVRTPLTVDRIQAVARIPQRSRVRDVLNQWSQFLELIPDSEGDVRRNRYHLYHWSFYEFVRSKEEVADMENQIADVLWDELMG